MSVSGSARSPRCSQRYRQDGPREQNGTGRRAGARAARRLEAHLELSFGECLGGVPHRTRTDVVPLRSLGKRPRERRKPSCCTIQISSILPEKSRGGVMLSRSASRPSVDIQIGGHHRPLVLVDQHRDMAGRQGRGVEAAFDAGQPGGEGRDLAWRPGQVSGRALDPRQPLVERAIRSGSRRGGCNATWRPKAAAAAAARAPTPRQKRDTVPQSVEPAARRDVGCRPELRWAILSKIAAGGSTAGADSASRLSRSSQSSTESARLGIIGHQPLDALAGGAAQRAEGIVGGESVAQLGVSVVHRSTHLLSWIRLRRIQLFTVPRGAPRRAATSPAVRPP